MKVGDIITVRALHADGQWYRRWQTTVESIDDGCIVTYSPSDSTVEDIGRQLRTLPHALRSYYWFDQPYNLLEVVSTDGLLKGVYVNVASAPQFVNDEMVFTDYELDVWKPNGQPAQIVDQDEFEEAVVRYGYSAEFQALCWQAAEEARALADRWQARSFTEIKL